MAATVAISGATGFLGRALCRGLAREPRALALSRSAGIYKTIEPGNPIGLLQEALVLSVSAEPLEKRLRVEGVKTGRITALDLPGQIEQAVAIGLLNADEARLLRDYDRKVKDIVNVDDFITAELMAGVQADAGAAPLRHIA